MIAAACLTGLVVIAVVGLAGMVLAIHSLEHGEDEADEEEPGVR